MYKNPIYLSKEQRTIIWNKLRDNRYKRNGLATKFAELTDEAWSHQHISFVMNGKTPANALIRSIIDNSGVTEEELGISLDGSEAETMGDVDFDKDALLKWVEQVPVVERKDIAYKSPCPCGGTIRAIVYRKNNKFSAGCRKCGIKIFM